MPDPSYEQLTSRERLICDATEELCRVMQEKGITRVELARRMNRSKGFITQVLSGRNVTLNTLADMAHALGVRFTLEIRDA